jgi:hypothetical protein
VLTADVFTAAAPAANASNEAHVDGFLTIFLMMDCIWSSRISRPSGGA